LRLNSRTYSAIAKTSADTAQRDLTDLLAKKIVFANEGQARRTSYRLDVTYDPNIAEQSDAARDVRR
jgi:hypothetical protein